VGTTIRPKCPRWIAPAALLCILVIGCTASLIEATEAPVPIRRSEYLAVDGGKHSLRRGDAGQHPRQPRPALAVARRRTAGLGRLGVRRPSRRPQRVCAPRSRLHPSSYRDARAARDQSLEVAHSGPRRASDRRDQNASSASPRCAIAAGRKTGIGSWWRVRWRTCS